MLLSQEQIGYMKTEDLGYYIARLEDERRTLMNRNFNVRYIEVEIAHVQREIEYRMQVAAAHQEYIQSNPEALEDWA